MKRILSIDITKGIVMVIMALDHVRDLMHVNAITQSPTNLETTTPILFFTRWVTHLCAPAFVFLAGTSAFLSYKKNQNLSLNRSFLIKRGIYLVFLEFLVVNFILFFDAGFHTLIFEVIAAIGFGFIILGLFLNLPVKAIGWIGLAIIFLHNLSTLIPFAENSTGKIITNFFFNLTAVPVFPNHVFVMAYPPIPWLGIMLVGFAAGKFFEVSGGERKSLLIRLGLLGIIVFIILRFINVYGDPVPWSSQKSLVFSFLSFMNVSKYPPSLQFCMVTLGFMLIILGLSEGSRNTLSRVFSVYGKVPLFYFLSHLLVIHLLMIGLMFLQGFSWSQMDFAAGSFGRLAGVQSGVSLGLVYLIWIGVVVLLYKPCVWYGKYKSAKNHWWLKYL